MKKFLSVFLSIVIVLTTITFTVSADSSNAEDLSRYTVLILDTSGSMSGTPRTKQKEAAIKFCTTMLEANGTNMIAIVKLNTSSSVGCNFTNDLNTLITYINKIPASGGTNINQAFEVANSLLLNVNDSSSNVIKNIVLCSDGLPESGYTTSEGPYTSSDYSGYRYANYVYNTAQLSMEEYNVYTLAFFHSLSGKNLAFGKRFMEDIQDCGYYDVTNPDELEFVFGDIANDIVNETKEITFSYQSGSDYTAKCYYTDDYFAKSSYIYNSSLATMSVSFAMSAFGSGEGGQDYSNKSKNARNLLEYIGINPKNIATNDWFTRKPTTDSIGVIAGNKPITVRGKDYTLIALAVRGGGYEQEWASNFTIGTSGLHSGFNTAKTNVLSFLKDYIEDQNITGPVKLWITGYSRAAATANLVGGAIDNGETLSNNITYDLDDVFTYCFETPAGALTSQVKNVAKYNNIFNIINSSDPVPYVAPAALGFGRYGVDKYLPSAESTSNYSDLKIEMLKVYNSLSSTDSYIVDDFQMKKLGIKNGWPGGEKISLVKDDTKNNWSQGVYLSNYVTIISNEFIRNRDNYVSSLQGQIREICSVMFGCTNEQSKILIESIVSQAKENWGSLLGSYIWNVGVNPWGSEDDALQIVSDWLNNAIEEAGITNYDRATIDAAGKNLGDLLLALVSNHPNYFTTAIMNGSGLGAAHVPELCYSWLASMDKNYNNNPNASFNNGGYRIIRINCEVDVNVTDSKGNTVASIVNENAEDVNNSIICGVDDDGQKYVILPIDVNYDISITAREDGIVNYGISEYCAQAGDFTRNVNYFDIDLEQGETISGDIPAYSHTDIEYDTPNGSSAKYSLYDSDNKKIYADSDLCGDEATDAYYEVNAVSSDETQGVTIGSGFHQYGQFAQVEAVAKPGYGFIGWYVDDQLISDEESYRVCVREDISIEARFELTCEHMCHNTSPFINFFYRIICFFWKLFGTNQYCSCGYRHW